MYSSEYSDSAPCQQREFPDLPKFIPLDEESLGPFEFNLGVQELSEAITSLKGGKTPRPDGLPVEIYKSDQNGFIQGRLSPHKESAQHSLWKPPTMLSCH